jgi:hypothetical protein
MNDRHRFDVCAHRTKIAMLVLTAGFLLVGDEGAAAQESLMRRPVTVSATLGSSPTLYNGQYTSSGVGRMCGETDPLQSFSGQRQFVVEFPLDDNGGSVVDLRFSSKTLVGSVRQTATFFVSITVKAANGGAPPAYVMDTERPAPRNSGTASLTMVKGEATLTVKGSDSLGQTLELTVTCGVPGR